MNINEVDFPEQLKSYVLKENDVKIVESKVIGTGEYGDVFEGFYKPRKEQVAVKLAKNSVDDIFAEAIISPENNRNRIDYKSFSILL